MNVGDIMTFVRDTMDVDNTDLPDSIIEAHLKDGFQRIYNLDRRYPFFEVSYTLNTVADQRAYALSSIGSGDLREVISVVDTSSSGRRLELLSYEEAEQTWIGSTDTPSRPDYVALWDDSIHLFPKPETVYPLSVRGYRKPSYTWVTNHGVEIDIDEVFHYPLAYYAISRAYQRQEDTEMSAVYKQSFDEGVALARQNIKAVPSYNPLILNGGSVRRNEKKWLEDLGRTLGQ